MTGKNSELKKALAEQVASLLEPTDPHLFEALGRWQVSDLQLIAAFFAETSLEALAGELAAYRLPPERLPLRASRHPFEGCSTDTIKKVVMTALANPEKEGDLTALVLDRIGVARERPPDYFLIEAHFNITELPVGLYNKLVSLGFEPDNFFKLQPRCYRHNLTLAFSPVKKPRERFDYLRGVVAARSEAAAELVQKTEGISGFFEAEVYPSSWIKRYSFQEPTEVGLQEFPFRAGSFDVLQVPCAEEEALPGGLAVETRKLADIHVKVPTEARLRDYPMADSPSVLELRRRLLEIGFYEIISESGNAIYTGQFISSKEATDVFYRLDDYATRHGGFLDLVCEPCTAFWRKQSRSSGRRTLAEVSPILSLARAPELAGLAGASAQPAPAPAGGGCSR